MGVAFLCITEAKSSASDICQPNACVWPTRCTSYIQKILYRDTHVNHSLAKYSMQLWQQHNLWLKYFHTKKKIGLFARIRALLHRFGPVALAYLTQPISSLTSPLWGLNESVRAEKMLKYVVQRDFWTWKSSISMTTDGAHQKAQGNCGYLLTGLIPNKQYSWDSR